MFWVWSGTHCCLPVETQRMFSAPQEAPGHEETQAGTVIKTPHKFSSIFHSPFPVVSHGYSLPDFQAKSPSAGITLYLWCMRHKTGEQLGSNNQTSISTCGMRGSSSDSPVTSSDIDFVHKTLYMSMNWNYNQQKSPWMVWSVLE